MRLFHVHILPDCLGKSNRASPLISDFGYPCVLHTKRRFFPVSLIKFCGPHSHGIRLQILLNFVTFLYKRLGPLSRVARRIRREQKAG
jgi:hypothetical protein